MSDEAYPDNLTFLGGGTNFTPTFSLPPGLATFNLTHEGQGPIRVRLLARSGSEVECLFEAPGAFTGGRALGLTEAGEFLFDIVAEGAWSLSVNPADPLGVSICSGLPSSDPAPTDCAVPGCGITAERFMELAGELNLERPSPIANPNAFGTGSFGWRARGDIEVEVDQVVLAVRLRVHWIVSGSKQGQSVVSQDEFFANARPEQLRVVPLTAIPCLREAGFGWNATSTGLVPLADGRYLGVNASAWLTVVGSH